MIKGIFWFTIGVGVTAVVVWKAKQLYQQATPAAMQQRLVDQSAKAGSSVAQFFDDIKFFSAAREMEIREALGVEEEVDEPAARRADATWANI